MLSGRHRCRALETKQAVPFTTCSNLPFRQCVPCLAVTTAPLFHVKKLFSSESASFCRVI
jgi:hypothetical protein